MKSFATAAWAGALALGLAGAAQAAFPTYYADQGAFEAQGTIGQTTNFDSYGDGFTLLGNSTSDGALTFSGSPGIVVGTGTVYAPVRNLFATNDLSTFTEVSIDAIGYNMLGFKLGNITSFGEQVLLQLDTNVATYYYGLYPGPAPENLTFQGFVTPLGEYFTHLRFNHTELNQAFGLTDVEIGASTPPCNSSTCDVGGGAPEPRSWLLMILGFGLAGAAIRNRLPRGARAA